MQVSVSDLLPFLDCEYKGQVRLHNQRWVAPTFNMRLGTWFHEVAATSLEGKPLPDTPEEFTEFIGIRAQLIRFCQPPPFDVVSIETPLSFPLSKDVNIVMRLDGLIRTNGDMTDLQWKTVGKGKDIGKELERIRMSPHEITYRRGMRLAGIQVWGTSIGIIRTYLTKEQRKENIPSVQLYALPATKEEDDAAWEDIEGFFKRLTRSKSTLKNWNACFSNFGVCPLLSHCHHGASINDLLPERLVNRYPDITPNSAVGATVGA